VVIPFYYWSSYLMIYQTYGILLKPPQGS